MSEVVEIVPNRILILLFILVLLPVLALAYSFMSLNASLQNSVDTETISELKSCLDGIDANRIEDSKHINDIAIRSYIKSTYKKVPDELIDSITVHLISLCSKNSIPVELMVGLVEVESNFNPMLCSKKEARGLAQVRYSVWGKKFGIKSKFDLHKVDIGINTGILVLKEYLEQNDRDISKALYLYVGKDSDYILKVYEAMGRFILHKNDVMMEALDVGDTKIYKTVSINS